MTREGQLALRPTLGRAEFRAGGFLRVSCELAESTAGARDISSQLSGDFRSCLIEEVKDDILDLTGSQLQGGFACPLSFSDTSVVKAMTTPEWSMTHFDMFLKVNSPRFVGKLTSKVNSRSESEQ